MTKVPTMRRLAAILAADVVGYSRMIGEDEAGTLAALRRIWSELFNPAVVGHRGRVVKMLGDGALVEFGSAVDAVECAVAIQNAMSKRNEEAEAKPLQFRSASISAISSSRARTFLATASTLQRGWKARLRTAAFSCPMPCTLR